VFDKTLVPLYMLYCMNGEIRGRTRFQKLVFLTKEKVKEKNDSELDIAFTCLHYGPFSRDLMESLKTQSKEGTVDEQLEENSYGLTYVYKLTDSGLELIENAIGLKLIPKDVQHMAKAVAKNFGEMPLEELIARVYREYPDYDPHRQ